MNSPVISVTVGATINCTVAAANHPGGGLLVAIEGNPNGFIPTTLLAGDNQLDKSERRAFLIANSGVAMEVVVKEAQMVAPKVKADQKPARAPAMRPRIILDEHAVMLQRDLEVDRRMIAELKAGIVLHARVMQPCLKDNADGSGRHLVGYFVELETLYMAFVHKSEVSRGVTLNEGDYIYVAVRSAEMRGNRPMISVSQKAAEAAVALSEVKPGSKTTGRNLRPATVEGVEGFTMEVGRRVKAFLPLSAVEGDPLSLLKGNRTAKVTVLPLTIGEYVQVTRRSLVAEVVARVERTAA